jgi:hypothetical protein
MNPIDPMDDSVPSTLGLTDAWEAIHPQATEEAGHTWGYQPHKKKYKPKRFDKVLFLGHLAPVFIERIGVGQTIDYMGEDVWLSDHYGLVTQLNILDK